MLLSHKIHSHNQRYDKNPPPPMKITEAIRVPLARFISVTFNFLTAKIPCFWRTIHSTKEEAIAASYWTQHQTSHFLVQLYLCLRMRQFQLRFWRSLVSYCIRRQSNSGRKLSSFQNPPPLLPYIRRCMSGRATSCQLNSQALLVQR